MPITTLKETKVTAILKSTLRAATLSLALAFGMTTGHAILKPATAQAGVLGGLKKAASTVGGAVKKAAVTVGSAGKKVAVTVGSAGKTIGVGIGRNAKQGAEVLARSPLGHAVKAGIKPVVKIVRR
jgi:hypothetical protein